MKRYILPGVLLLLGAWVSGVFENLEPCRTCDGSGVVEIGRKTYPEVDCRECHPSYRWDRARHRLEGALKPTRALLLILVVLSIPGGMVWGLVAVDCKICRGGGTLVLEATPPGERRFEVQVACPGCRGWGRLGALDSLLLRMGWE